MKKKNNFISCINTITHQMRDLTYRSLIIEDLYNSGQISSAEYDRRMQALQIQMDFFGGTLKTLNKSIPDEGSKAERVSDGENPF